MSEGNQAIEHRSSPPSAFQDDTTDTETRIMDTDTSKSMRITEAEFVASASDFKAPATAKMSDDGVPCKNYKNARRDFLRAYPEFRATEGTTGRLLWKEYSLLLGDQRTYADYGGAGQPMASVLREFYDYQRTHVLGNPHSENASSSRSARLERTARDAAPRFLGVDPESERYHLIWTANASAAFGLIRQHYFDDVRRRGLKTTVVMTDDTHNSMNGVRTVGGRNAELGGLVDVVIVPVNIKTLLVDETLFQRATPKLQTNERGIVLLTAQSNLSGIKQNYPALLHHAKQNGWDTVLDVAALLPTTGFNLAEHPEVDAIAVSWYKILGTPALGCLVVSEQFFQRMEKRWFAGGTVSSVWNTTVDAFQLLKGAERFQDGTIAYGAMPLLSLGLEKLLQRRVREDGARRVRCLVHWLTEELLAIRWPTRHPLVRVVGFPYLSEGWAEHGGTISVVLYDGGGLRTPYSAIFERLERFGVDLRHGCMCNTVATVANPGITKVSASAWRWRYTTDRDSWELVPTAEYLPDPEADVGVVRISLGVPSTFEDVFRIVEFAKSLVVWPLGIEGLVVPRKKVRGSLVDGLKRWWLRRRVRGELRDARDR